MLTIVAASVMTAAVIAFVLMVRERDLPPPEPVSPFAHLDERKASIYENLRDLQFEYRLGKLSDHDYQQTKVDLQKELAGVLAEIDRVKEQVAPKGTLVSKAPAAKKTSGKFACPHCRAEFAQDLKFCGECGKPMRAA